MSISKAQFGGLAVLAIVLMRLAAGYHFYTEGVKKLEPGFSSEGFLRGAKGPLADYFKSFAPGPHGAYDLLWQPRKWESLSEEQASEQQSWRDEYTKLARELEASNKKLDDSELPAVLDAQFPPHAPTTDWAKQIDKDWQQQHDAFLSAIKADEAGKKAADRIYRTAKLRLAEYLESIDSEVEEYQHKLWRLEELKAQVNNKGGTLPYQDDRIRTQQAEAIATPRAWIAQVNAIEEDYHDQLVGLLDEEQSESQATVKKVDAALSPMTTLDQVNLTVTWVVIGCGVLLFLGLFTRVAAVVAAGFLLSVIATQPPWVYGADTTYLGYQLFEIAGLLTLAAVGAGRWLGIDSLCSCCCGSCPTETA